MGLLTVTREVGGAARQGYGPTKRPAAAAAVGQSWRPLPLPAGESTRPPSTAPPTHPPTPLPANPDFPNIPQ